MKTKDRGLKRVLPGSLRTCSQPSSRKNGHKISRKSGAAIWTAMLLRGKLLACETSGKMPDEHVGKFTVLPDTNAVRKSALWRCEGIQQFLARRDDFDSRIVDALGRRNGYPYRFANVFRLEVQFRKALFGCGRRQA
jgi:hypothetical protein